MSPSSDPHADMDQQLRQRLRAVEDKLEEPETLETGVVYPGDAWFAHDILRHYRGPLSEKQRLRVLRILEKYEDG